MEVGKLGPLMLCGAALVVLAGQWVKRHKKWDSRLPVAVMALLGMVLYGLRYGWPILDWDPIDAWIMKSLPWSLLLPGAASTLGAFVPWFRTDSKPKETP